MKWATSHSVSDTDVSSGNSAMLPKHHLVYLEYFSEGVVCLSLQGSVSGVGVYESVTPIAPIFLLFKCFILTRCVFNVPDVNLSVWEVQAGLFIRFYV